VLRCGVGCEGFGGQIDNERRGLPDMVEQNHQELLAFFQRHEYLVNRLIHLNAFTVL